MRPISALSMAVSLAATLGLLAACNGSDKAASTSPTGAATSADTPSAPVADEADISMRYACDAGTSVVILRGERARASLPDGLTVDMGKIADSTPPVFSGSGLYFSIGDSDAHLSQEDGTELTCRPQ